LYAPNPIVLIDPKGLKPGSATECRAILEKIKKNGAKLDNEFQKYKPSEDAEGGFEYTHGSVSGITKPGGHYEKIRTIQRGIKSQLMLFGMKQCKCVLRLKMVIKKILI
jgi:hypothetical protein